MGNCIECGRALQAGAKYCGACGVRQPPPAAGPGDAGPVISEFGGSDADLAELLRSNGKVIACPKCGELTRESGKFCRSCGHDLPGSDRFSGTPPSATRSPDGEPAPRESPVSGPEASTDQDPGESGGADSHANRVENRPRPGDSAGRAGELRFPPDAEFVLWQSGRRKTALALGLLALLTGAVGFAYRAFLEPRLNALMNPSARGVPGQAPLPARAAAPSSRTGFPTAFPMKNDRSGAPVPQGPAAPASPPVSNASPAISADAGGLTSALAARNELAAAVSGTEGAETSIESPPASVEPAPAVEPPQTTGRTGSAALPGKRNAAAARGGAAANVAKQRESAHKPKRRMEVSRDYPSRHGKRTIDDVYTRRVTAECEPGLPGLVCRERIRYRLCQGWWSETPPTGMAVCRTSRRTLAAF